MEIIEKTEDEAGQRMYGLTRRHKFHPQPYNSYVNESQTTPQNPSPIENTETNLGEQVETPRVAKENNVPPNLPI